jgi:hypothetical protein
VGGALWGCTIAKRGRKKRFYPDAIVRMVDLRAAGHSRRSASEKVSSERGGDPDAETLRKHFRTLERSGQLPASAPPEERKAEQIVKDIQFFQEREEQAQRQRIALEKEAEVLGLDLEDRPIGDLVKDLDRRRDRLDTIVKQASHWTASYYRQQGITDPETVKARYRKDVEDLRLLEKQVDLLRRLWPFRPDPF